MELPKPKTIGKISLEECIHKRRSVRNYLSKELTDEQLSQLLWAGQGIRHGFYRNVPSAGATYPLEIRLVKSDGVFHYIPREHKIIKEIEKDLRKELAMAALGQSFIYEAPVDFVISCVYERTTRRYGERGIMYVHMEVGHCAQNIALQAVALGLATVQVGAFYPDEVKKLLMLPENETPVYIIPVGYPSE